MYIIVSIRGLILSLYNFNISEILRTEHYVKWLFLISAIYTFCVHVCQACICDREIVCEACAVLLQNTSGRWSPYDNAFFLTVARYQVVQYTVKYSLNVCLNCQIVKFYKLYRLFNFKIK